MFVERGNVRQRGGGGRQTSTDAVAQPGVYGARMTGGGFGGAIVGLARVGAGREAGREIARRYQEETGSTVSILV